MAISIIIYMFVFSACSIGGNHDFDYMTEKNIMKISIQSIRDQSYKFIVTDSDVISDIYEFLSNGIVVDEKSDLEPDYIIEIYESPTEFKSFKYIAGIDKKDGGNFYNEDSQYIISNRLDNDIIKNFTMIRRPIDFDNMYYASILSCLQKYSENNSGHGSIGVNILEDKMVLKFQLTTEIETFKDDIKKVNNASYVNSKDDLEDYDILMNVHTVGYTSDKYKAIVSFKIKGDTNPDQYYINNEYKNGEWVYSVALEEPEGF